MNKNFEDMERCMKCMKEFHKKTNNKQRLDNEDKYATYRPDDVDKGIAILSAVCLTVALSIFIVIPCFIAFDSFGAFLEAIKEYYINK